MLSFKDQIEKELTQVFLNTAEFGEEHLVNGKRMTVVLTENQMAEHKSHWEAGVRRSFDSGIYNSSKKLYVRVEDFGPRPKVGGGLELDGKVMYVLALEEQAGLYVMTVDRKRQ